MATAVYLTFDDGPDPEWTPRVLDQLAAAQARATFFMIGSVAKSQPALVRRVLAAGHAIGNHGYGHRHPWLMRETAARAEVRDSAAALAEVGGTPTTWYRPAHGRVRRCMVDEAAGLGQSLVLWDRSAVDWGLLGHAPAIRRRLQATRGGEIVLMHDGPRGINRTDQLLQVLPGFLAVLQERALRPTLLGGRDWQTNK